MGIAATAFDQDDAEAGRAADSRSAAHGGGADADGPACSAAATGCEHAGASSGRTPTTGRSAAASRAADGIAGCSAEAPARHAGTGQGQQQ